MRVLVLGLGVSGEYAALLLRRDGAEVVVVDGGAPEKQAERVQRLTAAGVTVSFTAEKKLPEGHFDQCVVSPAIPLEHPWLRACSEAGIPVISELQLGARTWRGGVIAVTGSKGKSSLVKLIADTLRLAGRTSSPAGNYGIPLCQLALTQPDLDWAIVEVSSFQMEHTDAFSPQVAILLNLQADHLDRHGTMERYRAMKMRLFKTLNPGALALFPEGFPVGKKEVSEEAQICRFGKTGAAQWRYQSGQISGQGKTIPIRGSWFDNPILGAAAAAAAATLLEVGLTEEEVREGMVSFRPLPHRMQQLGRDQRGVLYVDDSKSTTLSSVAAALQMLPPGVRLIAGGLLKENDLDFVKELLTQTTKKVYLIGQCSEQMFRAWSPVVLCEKCETMERAVARAVSESVAGETVLLSPGTASFDQFTGYRERGERFQMQVCKNADLVITGELS